MFLILSIHFFSSSVLLCPLDQQGRVVMAAAKRLTPSQKHFLSMYRKGVRSIRAKPEDRQPDFYIFLRQQFKAPFQAGTRISKRDFAMIDYLGRTINRTLENYFFNSTVKRVTMGQAVTPEELGSARILKNGQRIEGAGRTG